MKYFRTCTGLKHRNYRHILGISDTAYIYFLKLSTCMIIWNIYYDENGRKLYW